GGDFGWTNPSCHFVYIKALGECVHAAPNLRGILAMLTLPPGPGGDKDHIMHGSAVRERCGLFGAACNRSPGMEEEHNDRAAGIGPQTVGENGSERGPELVQERRSKEGVARHAGGSVAGRRMRLGILCGRVAYWFNIVVLHVAKLAQGVEHTIGIGDIPNVADV